MGTIQNNMNTLHLFLGSYLADHQSQNPRHNTNMPAVLFNRLDQIQPISERNFVQFVLNGLLNIFGSICAHNIAHSFVYMPVDNVVEAGNSLVYMPVDNVVEGDQLQTR